jgi:hypothetical protein
MCEGKGDVEGRLQVGLKAACIEQYKSGLKLHSRRSSYLPLFVHSPSLSPHRPLGDARIYIAT